MGGCYSESKMAEDPMTIKKWNHIESQTKQFEKGEVYYMLNKNTK